MRNLNKALYNSFSFIFQSDKHLSMKIRQSIQALANDYQKCVRADFQWNQFPETHALTPHESKFYLE